MVYPVSLKRIIDCHHHLWDLGLNYYPWLSDRIGPRMYGDYSAMRRNYLPDDFRQDIADLPVVASVHVQAEHDHFDPVRETRWLQSVADSPAGGGVPQAIVAFADLSGRPEPVAALLAEHAQFRHLRGIRQMVHQCLVPAMNLPTDYLADEQWRSNVGLLARHGLSFDLQILPPQADAAARLAAQHPDIDFALVHAGQPRDQSPQGFAAWSAALRQMAQQPNVCIKLSGFGMFDVNWTVDSLRPLILTAIDCFGPSRCMFGSNFPVDKLMRGYHELWQAYDDITRSFSEEERAAMFHGTAARVYRIAVG
jgi:predicted TIM-barrel fold metal-dependent hydrolase